MSNNVPLVLEFKGDVAGIRQSLATIEKDLKKFQDNTKKSGETSKEMGAKTIAAGAIMASVFQKAAKEIGKFAKDFVSAYTTVGGEVRKLRRVLGGTAEDMSKLRFAAEHVGVNVDSLAKGMRILSVHLLKNDEQAKQLGVTYRDQAGNLLPSTEILANISEKFSKMPAGLDKTALAVRAFGRSATELLPLLNLGKAGLEEMYANADKLGLVMSGKDLEAVKTYTLNQRELHSAIQGLQLAVGRDLVPQIAKFAKLIVEKVIPVLQSFVNGLMGSQGLVGATGKAATEAEKWGRRIRAVIGTVISLKNEIVIITGIIAAMWGGAKAYLAITKIVGAIKLMRLAYMAMGDQALLAAVKEKLASAGGLVTALVTLAGRIGIVTVAHEAQAVAAGTAAVAEAGASLGLATPMIIGGMAAVAAALIGAGIYVKKRYDAQVNTPKVLQPGDPGFIGPVFDKSLVSDDSGVADVADSTPKAKSLLQTLKEQSAQMAASIRLRSMGASKGLVDAVLGSENWKKEFGKLVAGGKGAVRTLQNLFNQTSTGRQEVADLAGERLTGRLGRIDRGAMLGVGSAGSFAKQKKVLAAYIKQTGEVIADARAEEIRTRGTDQHKQAVESLNKAVAEQHKLQKALNKVNEEAAKNTKKMADSTADLNRQQAILNTSMTASNSFLAAQVRTAGPTGANAGSFINVPVVIDGQTVFRVVQKYSLKNNRRNVSNGLSVSGSTI